MNDSLVDHIRQLLRLRKDRWTKKHRDIDPFTLRPVRQVLDEFPSGVSEADLESFSTRHKVELPEQLGQWLLLSNGAAGFYGVSPAPVQRTFDNIWQRYPAWRRFVWFPVADDGFGNFFVLTPPSHGLAEWPVSFIEVIHSTTDPAYVVASDLFHFLAHFLERQLEIGGSHAWPFDRKYVLARDPRMEDIESSSLPMPWDA